MDYKDVIESRYNRQNWLLLLRDIFGNKAKFWSTPYVVGTNSQMAKQALWLGTISLSDEQTIAIYEVELTDKVNIERNRRGIRDMLLTQWRNNGNAGAFMFCYRENESVLRFSYVSESWKFDDDGSYQKESTDTKRFTYLLGEGHRSRTAIQQFETLKGSAQTLKDLTKAFSVDAVSDMFFKDYKEQYANIIFYITGKRMVKKGNKWEEVKEGNACRKILDEFSKFADPEKAVRDYVKKLMGRLVFLQFLQKKGWLGVPLNEEWGNGDHEFIQNLFANTKDKDNFVDGVLEVLFDDLNTERKDDISQLSIFNYQLRIPYLNGGLFERDATDETNFPLPAKYMESMLDFFSQYNFTIDENDPNDAEVGVDPEMLGRIFENLLEDNKDKGAFYTPKEIVQYMCRESLIAYLQTDQNEEYKESIRQFVTTHNAEILGGIKEDIDKKLLDVKICDPAIGSGAFPMGLLKELYLCRSAIESIHEDKASEIKKHIIQHNIYGVDIEKGAVDIARLRFWLSLIVDEKTPHALPNLDFKIMQGNSLLEQYKGVDLSTVTEKKRVGEVDMFEDMVDALRLDLRNLLAQYYDCTDHKEKKALRKKITDNVKQQLLEQGITINFGDLDLAGNDQFFLWHTWFYDVFSQGGFDIVIGNPPYVEAKKLKYIANTLKGIYNVYSGTADLSIYFIELGAKLLCDSGELTYITTNKFFNTGYGQKVRMMISANTIHQIINFEQVEVFEDILVSSVIVGFAKKEVNKGNTFTYEKFYKLKKEEFIPQFLQKCDHFGTYSQNYIDDKEWSFADLTSLRLKSKLEQGSTRLGDIEGVNIYRGVTTGFNPAFIISDEQRDTLISSDSKNREVIKNMLQGRNIRKWYYNKSNEYLLQTGFDTDIESEYPLIYNHFLRFRNKLEERADQGKTWYNLRACKYYDDFEKQQKIIWGLTADKWAFTLDEDKHYLPSNGYILTSVNESISYLLGVLNSKLMHYYFHFIGIMTAGGAYTLKAATISALPFKIAQDTNTIAGIVQEILSIKASDHEADVSQLEDKIDLLVYHLYNLTYDEVLIIDPETSITREDYTQR